MTSNNETLRLKALLPYVSVPFLVKILVFVNTLLLGGSEKAACRWARGFKQRGHEVSVLTLIDGPRRHELLAANIPANVIEPTVQPLVAELKRIAPDVIHFHAPGQPHMGDTIGSALAWVPKIPLVQTNIFGRLENPAEDAWTDFRLFISWTSCVQAARRASVWLDESFFRRASVAVYPVEPVETPAAAEIRNFRERIGVADNEVLFGRFSRPEPNKWTNLALDAFQFALRRNPELKLLLREPPPLIVDKLRASRDANKFIILPATADVDELRLTMAAVDVVLHTSSIGESFGYGIAEPMNLGKPVITHSVPWLDQAQIELVRHNECGLVASTPRTMGRAILRLARDRALRERLGTRAQRHIRSLADPAVSLSTLERALQNAVAGRDNASASDDLRRAEAAAAYLDSQQFGHTLAEQITLRLFYYRVQFHRLKQSLKKKPVAGNPVVENARSSL